MKTGSRQNADGQLRAALRALRSPAIGVSGISCFSNILMLTGPMFMMLVYNKVLSSKSVPTLAALSLLVILLYAFYGLLEGLRGKLMARVGVTFDHYLAPILFEATLRLPLYFGPHARNHDPLQDLALIRNYLMSSGPTALLDLPWMPIYFAILFMVHPMLGFAAGGGALFLVGLSMLNQGLTRRTVRAANQVQTGTMTLLTDARRNAEAAAAMSMGEDLCRRWGAGYVDATTHACALADQASVFGATAKTARLVLQSGMLAIGAYLAIEGEISPGSMVACSIIMARALSPIDHAIAYWRSTSAAWQALRRLKALIARLPKAVERQHSMPRPQKALAALDIAIVPPGSSLPAVAGISFEIEAGDVLGIIGPSGAGKSSLVRALVGAWPATRGEVRFDHVPIGQYSPETLADVIGHLPQTIELFDGTIADNIARFRKDYTTDQVVEAARIAGVHDMILSFPLGYNTPVGEGGAILSGGQRQRIALARAVFGHPFLVVLDEPNSNLDPLGEQCLNEAVQRMRQEGMIVVIVAHRPSAIFTANKILSLRNGRAEMFGPKHQVMAAMFPRVGQPHKPAPVAGWQANQSAAAGPRVSPAAGPQPEQPGPQPTTVTSLDLTRVRRTGFAEQQRESEHNARGKAG